MIVKLKRKKCSTFLDLPNGVNFALDEGGGSKRGRLRVEKCRIVSLCFVTKERKTSSGKLEGR